MGRLFVYSDNLTARVELIQDSVYAIWRAYCIGCVADDLLSGTHEGFGLEDAAEAAGMHADRCARCADPDCRTVGRHDAGHRCRKGDLTEMPSVPNWIAKACVYSLLDSRSWPIRSWRATTTQVVVTAEGLRGELRFSLETLHRVGGHTPADRGMRLVAPDTAWITGTHAVIGDLRIAMEERLDPSAMDAGELLAAVDRIQQAATKAIAHLGDLL